MLAKVEGKPKCLKPHLGAFRHCATFGDLFGYVLNMWNIMRVFSIPVEKTYCFFGIVRLFENHLAKGKPFTILGKFLAWKKRIANLENVPLSFSPFFSKIEFFDASSIFGAVPLRLSKTLRS